VVISLERGADLHTAQLMPLPLTLSCFSKIQIGFTFLVLAHLGSPGKGLLNGCVFLRRITARALLIDDVLCDVAINTRQQPMPHLSVS